MAAIGLLCPQRLCSRRFRVMNIDEVLEET